MATSLLEKTRALQEDVERCQRMIVQIRMAQPKTVMPSPKQSKPVSTSQ